MAASLMGIYKSVRWLPFGNWLFSKAVCIKAPYFGSIKPTITHLEAGKCVAVIKKRRSIQNHIGTIHAIAQCNLAELVAGVMTDATVPVKTHRWIPKGMTVQYLKKADGILTAEAKIDLPRVWQDKEDLIVPVEVYDQHKTKVFHADITMYITER